MIELHKLYKLLSNYAHARLLTFEQLETQASNATDAASGYLVHAVVDAVDSKNAQSDYGSEYLWSQLAQEWTQMLQYVFHEMPFVIQTIHTLNSAIIAPSITK